MKGRIIVGMVAVILLLSGKKGKADIVIDSWETPHYTGVNASPPASSSTYVWGVGILNDERDVLVEKLAGDAPLAISSTAISGILGHSEDILVEGTSLISWDGPDGDGSSLDYVGLGGLDLTDIENCPAQDAFLLSVIESDHDVVITIFVYTDVQNWSSYTLNVTGSYNGGAFPINSLILYSDFTPRAGTGADFTNVGAIALLVDPLDAFTDVILGEFRTKSTKACIGDYVWYDTDMDGLQDEEDGIGDITVNLYDCAGDLIDSDTTDSDGYYGFDNLDPGDYYVEFILPDGYVFSPRDQGNLEEADSDADPATGRTVCTTLDPGENDPTWDAGLYELACIGDYVWYDTDMDGLQDEEDGIGDIAVNLHDCGGDLIDSDTTDPNGYYGFCDLIPGTYYVEFILPDGYVFSPRDQGNLEEADSDADPVTGRTVCTTLEPGENDSTWDAGLYVPPPTPTPVPTVVVYETPMPTRTPTRPPTPVPVPVCSCEKITIDLSVNVVSGGEKLEISGCIPPAGEPVDIYLLVRAPWGDIYSVVSETTYQSGIVPYFEGYNDPDPLCSPLLLHWSCSDRTLNGVYLTALIRMPAGVALSRVGVIDYDLSQLKVEN